MRLVDCWLCDGDGELVRAIRYTPVLDFVTTGCGRCGGTGKVPAAPMWPLVMAAIAVVAIVVLIVLAGWSRP